MFSAARKQMSKIPPPRIYLIFSSVFKLQLRAYLFQGRDLLPIKKSNFADPVVFVSFLNNCQRSVVRHRTLNPVWDQTLLLNITYYGDIWSLQQHCENVILQVYDKDDKRDIKFMGRTFGKPIVMQDSEENQQAKLKWLEVSKGNVGGGSILAAFELYLKSENKDFPPNPPQHKGQQFHRIYKVPRGIRPTLQRTAIEMILWGVRNMKPFHLLSVDKPSILIQIGNIEIRTKPIKHVKKNPNFTEPLHFIIANLPVEALYFPPIIIRVKDHRKFGRRPTVGQYAIIDADMFRKKPIKEKPLSTDEGYDEKISKKEDDVVLEIESPHASGNSKKLSRWLQSSSKESEKDEELLEKQMSELDWWSRYYASVNEESQDDAFVISGLDKIKIYKDELEKQENFNSFHDFVKNFKLTRGEVKEDEEAEFAGEFKGNFCIYSLPEDPKEPLPPRFYESLPSSTTVEVKVRIYVVRAFDLLPQDSHGLADPYIKIKAGKKKIDDKSNYIPNTLNPVFGKMYELDLRLPVEKDLHIQVFEKNLITTDDRIGETVIDMENRYLSKYRAWCALPETYYTSGPTPWRDQRTPKELLNDKATREGWAEPVWNGNTCVKVNEKTYWLKDFEENKKISPFCGEAAQRLSLYVLRTFPHVSEHVETRPLFSKLQPGIEQGRLQLWVDLFLKELEEPGKPYEIRPRSPTKYFVRVIIWNCTNIPLMDTSMFGEKMTDIYFKGWLTGLEHKKQKTDVHYRSLDGSGMFNWRFVFPFEYLPQEKVICVRKKEDIFSRHKTLTKLPAVLNIQAWDNDLFRPNDYISEVVLPLNKMAKCCKFARSCKLNNVPDKQGNCEMEIVSMFDQKLLKGWWPLFRIVDGQKELAGKLEMSVEVVTEEEHLERPSGNARDEPNLNPKLEKPKRPASSFAWFSSPWKSFRYIILRKYKWQILGIFLLLVVIAFIVLLFYNLPGALLKHI